MKDEKRPSYYYLCEECGRPIYHKTPEYCDDCFEEIMMIGKHSADNIEFWRGFSADLPIDLTFIIK